jgi:hypothetical protein
MKASFSTSAIPFWVVVRLVPFGHQVSAHGRTIWNSIWLLNVCESPFFCSRQDLSIVRCVSNTHQIFALGTDQFKKTGHVVGRNDLEAEACRKQRCCVLKLFLWIFYMLDFRVGWCRRASLKRGSLLRRRRHCVRHPWTPPSTKKLCSSRRSELLGFN